MEKKHKLLTFYVKCLVISLPVILLVAFYAYKDPFMVLRSYADYDHSWVPWLGKNTNSNAEAAITTRL